MDVRVAMLSPTSVHPHRPEVCTYNFILPARAVFRYERAQRGFLETKGHLIPGFLGHPLLQPLSHSNVCCIMTEKGSKKPPKQTLLRINRIFAYLSWSEFALFYQRWLKPPKWALVPVPNCNNVVAQTAGTFASAACVWLSRPRTA